MRKLRWHPSVVFALIYALLAASCFAVGFAMFPRPEHPDRSAPIATQITTDAQINWAQVLLLAESPTADQLDVSISVWADKTADTTTDLELIVTVPSIVAGIVTCLDEEVACEYDTYTDDFADPYRQQRILATLDWVDAEDTSDLIATLRFRVSNYFNVLGCAGHECKGNLPQVFASDDTSVAPDSALLVDYKMQELSGYKWESDALATDSALPYLRFVSTIQRSAPQELNQHIPITGVRIGSAEADSTITFVMGALVGVGGGFLVAAIQETNALWFASRKPVPNASTATPARQTKRRRT